VFQRTLRKSLAFMALACLISTAAAQDATRTAEAVIKEIDAVKSPEVPRNTQDRAAVQEFLKARAEAQSKKAELTLELFKVSPDHDRIPALMSERWMTLAPDTLVQEVDEVLAHNKNEKLQVEGAYAKVRAAFASVKSEEEFSKAVPAIETFLKLAPKDPRAGQLLYTLAMQTTDDAKRAGYEDQLLAIPDSPYAGMIKDSRWKRDQVGKPFELEFDDAIKGTNVSIKGLKGKVVVVDFWATWCGPCVAEMPKMKSLYAEYKDKGVEFIGVSLDQSKEKGGLDKLKDFVAQNEIGWPQYYQGNYWQSEFSSNWKIKSIPCVFVIDQEGNLFSTDARGKLETLIPELLKKKSAAAASAGGF
jgi:thiol-disulfide isomerase/thioredoxin